MREVMAEAAAWMARLRADDRTDANIRDFQTWFAADTAHFLAFERVTAVWEAAGAARGRKPMIAKEGPSLQRRGVLAGLGALIVAGGSAGYWKSAEAKVYQTDIGEQKHVVLDDGTHLFLDTDTCCAVHFSDNVRNVELRYGRANFHTAPDGARIFSVQAAQKTIRTMQSHFDVRSDRDSNKLSVVVIQGRTFVDALGAAQGTTRELDAGQQLVAAASLPPVITRADLAQLLAWQRGQAIFDNTRLATALYEMNRYSSRKLAITDAAIADLRISGVYNFGDNNAFAGAVAKLLPVTADFDRGHDRIDLVANKNRAAGG